MNISNDTSRLLAKRKQLRLLMVMMLIFMCLSPLLGPKIFAEDFSKMKGVGLYVFYIGSPAIFLTMFVFNLILYRRNERTIASVISEDAKSSAG